MIDLMKLHQHKEAFGYFARQFAYPDEQAWSWAADEWAGAFAPPVAQSVQAYREAVQSLSADELVELYVRTFDFQKASTLYMTYFKFEDAKERGQMLVQLQAAYEMFGLEIVDRELPDYLPLMCEFLYAAEWLDDERSSDSLQLVLAVLEDGTYHLLSALEKCESPYAHLVRALRETVKRCVQQEVEVHD